MPLQTTSPAAPPDTEAQYRHVVGRCRALFLAKTRDYGAAWVALRPSSVTDQLFIKAKRIRTLQDTGQNLVGDSIESELVGIVNYAVIALLVCDRAARGVDALSPIDPDDLPEAYGEQVRLCWDLLTRKNHDYGEAWREMRVSSMIDLIMMKLLRIKQIEDNDGLVSVSENVEAGYMDILNYAVFALILLEEGRAA